MGRRLPLTVDPNSWRDVHYVINLAPSGARRAEAHTAAERQGTGAHATAINARRFARDTAISARQLSAIHNLVLGSSRSNAARQLTPPHPAAESFRRPHKHSRFRDTRFLKHLSSERFNLFFPLGRGNTCKYWFEHTHSRQVAATIEDTTPARRSVTQH